MKKLILSGLALATMSITIIGCNKENLSEIIEDNNKVENKIPNSIIGDYEENMKNCVENELVSYFLDGKEVKAGHYDPANEKLFTLIEGDSIENYVHFNTFTTKEQYFEFGRDNGYGDELEFSYLFEQHMKEYAIKSGAINEFENSGTVSEEYIQYEQEMYNRLMGVKQDRATPIVLYKDITGGISTISPTGYRAYFVANSQWNNAVSRYNHWVLYGFVHIYDKSFYRQRLGSIGRWGFQETDLIPENGLGYLNDKMSSVITS